MTRGVTVIALAQSFANVADIEDHAFNRPLSRTREPSTALSGKITNGGHETFML